MFVFGKHLRENFCENLFFHENRYSTNITMSWPVLSFLSSPEWPPFRPTCPIRPVSVVPSKMSSIPSRLSCRGSPLSPVQADLFRLTCSGWLVQADLFRLTCSGWPVQADMSGFTCPGWSIQADPLRLTYPGCHVLLSCPRCFVPTEPS